MRTGSGTLWVLQMFSVAWMFATLRKRSGSLYPPDGLARRVQRHHEPCDLCLALVLALPFKQEHRFVQRRAYAISFTAFKVAGVELATADAHQ